MTFKSRHLQTNKQTNRKCDFLGWNKVVFLWGFYAFGSSQRTFCSSAVISCSAFTSLNFRSLICLFESPAKVQPKNTLDLLDTSSSKTQQVRLGARGYSLWSSIMFGSAPFSTISPSGFELFSVPFRWVFCSNWDFSFFTCRPSPDTSADLCHHTTLSPALR